MEPKKLDEEASPNAVDCNESSEVQHRSLTNYDSEGKTVTNEDDRGRREFQFLDALERNAAAKLCNALASLRKRDLMRDLEDFAREEDLMHALDDLKKVALVAQKPTKFETTEELTEEDKEILRLETTHRWSHPFMVYFMTSRTSPRFQITAANTGVSSL